MILGMNLLSVYLSIFPGEMIRRKVGFCVRIDVYHMVAACSLEDTTLRQAPDIDFPVYFIFARVGHPNGFSNPRSLYLLCT